MGLPENFTAFDLAYGTARLSWQKEHRSRKFPKGTAYRLTLEEEASALRTTLKVYQELKESPNAPEEVAAALRKYGVLLDHLAAIDEVGMLEAHILLARNNPDLAQDYPDYRRAHRQLLHDYLARFYLHVQ